MFKNPVKIADSSPAPPATQLTPTALKVLYPTSIEKRKNRSNPTGRSNGCKTILNTLTIH